jgi:hypothetical protein
MFPKDAKETLRVTISPASPVFNQSISVRKAGQPGNWVPL